MNKKELLQISGELTKNIGVGVDRNSSRKENKIMNIGQIIIISIGLVSAIITLYLLWQTPIHEK